MDVGDRDSARMMVGGKGAEAEGQRSKAFVRACHPHFYTTDSEKQSVTHCSKEFRNTSTIHCCCMSAITLNRNNQNNIQMHSMCLTVFLSDKNVTRYKDNRAAKGRKTR